MQKLKLQSKRTCWKWLALAVSLPDNVVVDALVVSVESEPTDDGVTGWTTTPGRPCVISCVEPAGLSSEELEKQKCNFIYLKLLGLKFSPCL